MKITVFVYPVLLLALLLALGAAYAQQAAPGGAAQPTNPQQGGWYCPWCGTWQGPGMGQGMMGPGNCPWMGQGGMGQGMMGRGGMMQHGGTAPAQQQAKALTEEQAKTMVDNYVKSMNNPNLKVGKFVDEKDKDYYMAEIVTKEGSLVDKIQISKSTGWFRSAYSQ